MSAIASLAYIIHFLVSVALIVIILIQTSKGAGMGAAFGGASNTLFGTTGRASFLTKITIVAAVIFTFTSVGLSFISTERTGMSDKIKNEAVPGGAPGATGTNPSAPGEPPATPGPATENPAGGPPATPGDLTPPPTTPGAAPETPAPGAPPAPAPEPGAAPAPEPGAPPAMPEAMPPAGPSPSAPSVPGPETGTPPPVVPPGGGTP